MHVLGEHNGIYNTKTELYRTNTKSQGLVPAYFALIISIVVHVVKHQSVNKYMQKAVEPEMMQGSPTIIKWVELARNRNKWLRRTRHPYIRAVHANTEKMRDCHLVERTCDNEVGVAISIRDPYTSPFTRSCK